VVSAVEAAVLTEAQAEAVWGILEEVCGAAYDHGFINHQTNSHVVEWRFIGSLGFGGKFWRTTGKRPDGTWGECWLVNCYREDETPERLAAINVANERLWDLQRGLLADPHPT
jgi:hypothetical protein